MVMLSGVAATLPARCPGPPPAGAPACLTPRSQGRSPTPPHLTTAVYFAQFCPIIHFAIHPISFSHALSLP
ncbi:hypothetical protein Pmani_028172 [Petrolisthes manimaculis]|uniref:Uncharacterized protein n=1 Tax=Petrolisthes manimaculis TaxID=1843537 RepID=A0AAE1P2Q1_9EUCA|nr:hypothetical protein Pmani_028172 [Petrolisthes manimaculis]